MLGPKIRRIPAGPSALRSQSRGRSATAEDTVVSRHPRLSASRAAAHRLSGATLAAALLLAAAPASADSAKVGGIYDISFGGLSFAQGKLSLVVDGSSYSAKVSMRPASLARIFSSEQVDAQAAGWLRGATVQPTRYSMKASNSEKSSSVRMDLSSGTLKSVDVDPPTKPHKDVVPLQSKHWRGVLDPVSAVVMPVKNAGDALGPAACGRTLPIFDGWTRFDVALSYQGTKTVETKSYKGTVVVCSARWSPVAGHRRNKDSVRYMQNNRELEAWLAPVPGTSLLVPFRVSVGTMRGTLVVEASDLKISGPTVTAATSIAAE
jgi:hypothetical protein